MTEIDFFLCGFVFGVGAVGLLFLFVLNGMGQPPNQCDHEWEYVAFSYSGGDYCRCKKCGETK